ncbi:MAG: hypothetical protein AAF125_21635, partial [Chloroflexota bacterium]
RNRMEIAVSKKFEKHLENIDKDRRDSIKKIAGAAFVAPVVATFMMKGGVSVALAQVANSS